MPNRNRPAPADQGDNAEVFAAQDVWDFQYDPKRNIFKVVEGGPIKFTKDADGLYVVELRRTPKTTRLPETFHPFEVYRSPVNAAAPTENWRTFRVRAGAYGTTPVLGTDGADVAAGGNVAEGVNDVDDTATEVEDTAYNADFDIIVPDATLAYYIWIDAATDPAEPVIDHGATIPGGGTDDDWWNGSGYILIAIIDTATLTATKVAKRRQFVRDDIPKCPTT